jgi:putative ATP-binding cassette transporter
MDNEIYLAPSEQRLLSRFWQSARGFWGGASAGWAWLLTALLITTVLLQLLTQYWLNYWNRDFFNAVERKDAAELWTQALRFAPIAAASLVLAVFSVWGRMTLQRKWREWLSSGLYSYWLDKDRYVRLRFMVGEHQAPEYRIAEDARVATDLPVDLVLGLFSSFLTAITFIGILWAVGGHDIGKINLNVSLGNVELFGNHPVGMTEHDTIEHASLTLGAGCESVPHAVLPKFGCCVALRI